MNDIIEYVVKSGASLIIFYTVYHFVFKNDTNFKFNRLYLFSSILLSLSVPFLTIFETTVAEYGMRPIIFLEKVIASSNPSNIETREVSLYKIAVYVYTAISAIFALKLLYQVFQIMRLCVKNKITSHIGYKIVHISEKKSPFSFLYLIFINPNEYTPEDYNKIIAHEKIHVKQLHSIDIILIELLFIIFWFNPIIRLYKRDIAMNQEFLADSGVIEQGYEKNDYQMLILEQLFDNHSLNLVQNFNILLTKKRISMMEIKTKSSKYRKLLAILPVSFILLFFGAYNVSAQNNNEKQVLTICEDPDVLPEFPGGMLALRKHLAVNIIMPKEAKGKKIKAEYTVHFKVDEKGKVDVVRVTKGLINKEDEVIVVSYTDKDVKVINDKKLDLLFKKESERVINTLPDFKPAEKDGKKVKVIMQIPIVFLTDDKN